jgi:REP element-mobilizing transposase RayT
MARPLRIEYPGAFYHVINRGNAGEAIFRDDKDRDKFLRYLEKAVERFSLRLHVYCLMKNHYHLLIETPEANLSRALQWINVSYAAFFNRKHQRSGHLFQGRFRSILIEADEYLSELSRYIHLNPVKAGVVAAPEEYPWSSYRAFIGRTKPPDYLETEWLLSQFGRKPLGATSNYERFVQVIPPEELENPAKRSEEGFILGTEAFVQWVKDTFLSGREENDEMPQLKRLKPRLKPARIVQAVCDDFDCEPQIILTKGRKRNLARDISIHLARELTGESTKELGEYFGDISGAGITVRNNHLMREMHANPKLRDLVNRIKRKIVNN